MCGTVVLLASILPSFFIFTTALKGPIIASHEQTKLSANEYGKDASMIDKLIHFIAISVSYSAYARISLLLSLHLSPPLIVVPLEEAHAIQAPFVIVRPGVASVHADLAEHPAIVPPLPRLVAQPRGNYDSSFVMTLSQQRHYFFSQPKVCFKCKGRR